MTSQQPRAVFFGTFPPPYHGQNVATELARELLESDLQITAINTSTGDHTPSRPGFWMVGRVIRQARQIHALVRHLKATRPDILYLIPASSVAGHLRDLVCVRSARPYVGRIVAHIHGGNFHEHFTRPWHRRMSQRFVSEVDSFIFLSHTLGLRSARHIPSEKRAVVPNSIEEPLCLSEKEVEAKIAERCRRSVLRVAFVSNMHQSKGYMDVAAAVAMCRANNMAIEVDMVGKWHTDTDRHVFERFLAAHGLHTAVRLHGAVADRGVIKELLRSADVFTLPTYYPNEAQPVSIIEAMNAGTPIIATAHASIPEYVVDDGNGYLVSPRAPGEIAVALRRLADVGNWRKKARAARETYVRNFAPDVIRTRLLAAFLGE